MGHKLSTSSPSLTPTPFVNVRGDKGQVFVGTLKSMKSVDSGYVNEKTGEPRMQNIYNFSFESSDMEILVKNGKEYELANVNPGDLVAVFAPTRLNNALIQAPMGSRIQITYLGLGKAIKGKGGKPHEYDVEVL